MKKFLIISICVICVLAIAFFALYIILRSTPNDPNWPPPAAKPVIYLYPEEQTDITVNIDFDGELLCTYPLYNNGWNVTAFPDGKIIDKADGSEYSYLFWEGSSDKDYSIDEGFVVPGNETESFLKDKLSYMGLLPKEYNEFIVYWLPMLKDNKYNLISFVGDEYTEKAKLNIIPEPDSILRVFMVYKPLDNDIEIKEQELNHFNRQGFSVIEWGGCKLD